MRSFLILILLATPLHAEEKKPLLSPDKRIVFLGDSNTYAGRYIVYLEAQLRQMYPKKVPELINLGLPSETASGLSEPDHPFPRPDVHERAERALKKSKPDVVFVCYGMNDGIYYPMSKKRFDAYQQGILKLIKKIKAVGAKVVLMTPPPFDPVPLKKSKKLRPAGSEKYAWFAPYERYDEVLKQYADWIMKQGKHVDQIIDIHTPTIQHLKKARMRNPDYALARDGVHPNATGHRVIADAILKAMGMKILEPNMKLLKRVAQRQFLMRDAWLTHVGHKRPGVRKGLPLEEARKKAAELDKE